MTKVLHLSASPRGPRSESLAIARTFLDTLRDVSPQTPIETYDLWDGTLPPFGPDAAAAKMTVFADEQPQGAAADAWNAAIATFRRFDAADRYVFSVPMWNAGIPYILKQFIDVVSQPGLVFGFDPVQGYNGLLQGKRAAVIYTSAVYGPDRGPAFGADFQAPYVEEWLRWAGVDDIRTVHFRPNLATADADTGRRLAHAQARDLAKEFLS
ncbi:FMN-dependent NADH-azoreductase [Paractinoplanes lichenicola]|uniref:FMN dependent NADH:quinone oxidoreductase n=1 Tax=Paractinoplanes lichenicola TaxID=2802976 RepID=A0ABS1VYZ6_9ACTN|nr:NAD(P)H-dependent oxidoreductase [Actinoplanes lichenicola]MBL7259716.1 NAD(P)H-dependent oxidoreductase [Actinoplanes lichenicola]